MGMQMPQQKPQKKTWEDIKESLEIDLDNLEKRLMLYRAQLREVEKIIKDYQT